MFVNQLSGNAGISVWQIVWVRTNCRCMSDIEFLLVLSWWCEKKCRNEASDGFIVRPKEDGTLVGWWRGKVEEIWMKIIPLYMNCPRTESGPSCWEATSIHVAKKQNEQKLCSEHTDVLLRVWRLFLFLAFEFFFCRLYHVRVPPDNGATHWPPTSYSSRHLLCGQLTKQLKPTGLRSYVSRVVLRDLFDHKCCD
jgi:hypothetical protein